MRRIDYRRQRRTLPSLALLADRRLRRTATLSAAALAIVSGVAIVEAARWTTAARDLDERRAALTARDAEVAAVRALAHDVDRLERLAARMADVRASAPRSAAAIARLGDRLPGDVWVATLRMNDGSIALEGHSARLTAIPTALTALGGPAGDRAHLTMLQSNELRGGVDYTVVLRPAP